MEEVILKGMSGPCASCQLVAEAPVDTYAAFALCSVSKWLAQWGSEVSGDPPSQGVHADSLGWAGSVWTLVSWEAQQL